MIEIGTYAVKIQSTRFTTYMYAFTYMCFQIQ